MDSLNDKKSEAEQKRLQQVEDHMNKCWFLKLGKPGHPFLSVKMNPIVTIGAAVLLWSFIIAIAVAPDYMNYGLNQAKTWVADEWSWLYIVSQDIWIVALIYIAVHPKYGKIKLGRDDEEPAYSDITWFSLLFTCGVAVGMFYFAAEPMWHYKGWGGARFNDPTGPRPSEDAVHGMMVTWYHWGLHGWIPYTTIGALLGLLSYRRGFPLSVRFGLYPLIGDRVYGIIGDLVDIVSIVTTVMGVCTSLGLGTISINKGMARLSGGFYRGTSFNVPDDPIHEFPTCGGTGDKYWPYVKSCDEKWTSAVITSGANSSTEWTMQYQREAFGVQASMGMQVVIICSITFLATASVVLGMNWGIKNVSRLGFLLSTFFLLFVLFAGDTVFQLNLIVQSFGYYLWYLPKIAFHTDVFELLGKADMGRGGFEVQGKKQWMDIWTIFYWGWWISWGPFVGTFLAKISRGRTLRQFVLATLVVPSLYCFVWFGSVGGEITKMQTMAEGSGLCSVGWLNGGGKDAPGSKHCNLAAAEMDNTTGKCKDKAGLIQAGLIGADDEANCGREACSGDTLKKGLCGKMLPTCDHYAASYNNEQKRLLGVGFNPKCRLKMNENYRPEFSGRCQQFAWEHYEQKLDKCVKMTTWVDVPCGSEPDPTALKPEALGCGTGGPTTAKHCQDPCKDVITLDMVNKDNADRMYNHFTKGTVKSKAAEYIWDADKNLEEDKVWVVSNGVKRLEPPQCFVPAPQSQVCAWNQKTEDIIFDLIGSLSNSRGFSDLMCIIALISLVIYFITSSDSGSLVVDIMAANGEEEPPVPQRVFWALTEGATAIALLYSGQNVLGPFGDPGEGGLRALQAASIVMGLPYTFMLFWYSQALVQVCREEGGDLDKDRPRFKFFLSSWPADGEQFVMLVRNTFIPGFSPAVKKGTETWMGGWIKIPLWGIALQLMWISALLCIILGLAMDYNVFILGICFYFGFSSFVSLIRREIRSIWGIPRGDFFSDFMWTVLAYNSILTQLEVQMKEGKENKGDKVGDKESDESQII